MILRIVVRNVTADPRPFGIYGYKPSPKRRERFELPGLGKFTAINLGAEANPRELVTGIESDRDIAPGEIVALQKEAGPAMHGLEWYVKRSAHRCFEVRSFTLGDLSLILEPGLLGSPPVD